jgi:hypothetical protein
MATANINDPGSIERVYPADAFERDSAENDLPGSEMLKGVRVLSVPDAHGDFELSPATKHVAEAGDSAFLVPYRSSQPDPKSAYRRFLAEIIAATRKNYDPATSPGQGDPRIRGARQ